MNPSTPSAEAVAERPVAAVQPRPAKRLNYLNWDTSAKSWFLTLDHKRIGVIWLGLMVMAFSTGGFFALVLRTKLLHPGPFLISAQEYNRMFTLHGVVMVFFFLIPVIPGIFGNFLLPLMLGAKDVAFPKLNLLSVYLYITGLSLALWGMIHGGADTGWTFYTPYSTTTPADVTPILLGVFLSGLGSIVTGLNFIVTIHTMRAPGLHWMKMPLFIWSIYATSIIQVLATPVIGMVLVMVAFERTFGWGIFDPARGGDPILFQHLFWFYSHPAVYIMVLPSMAVVSEVVACYSRNRPYGYKVIAYSSLGIAFVGFLTWGHHMFVSGQSTFDAGVFGFLSMLVGIFSAAKIFSWVATMYKGSVEFSTPLFYIFGFFFLFVFGGMTGVAIATMSLDVPWHGTYFIVAHFHFIMVGATLMAFLAGLHYWFPLMFGRLYSERWSLAAAIMALVGFVGTFFSQFLVGNEGMPRRYYEYAERFQSLNVASTMFAYLLALGLMLALLVLAIALFTGEKAQKNPWGSAGFEWLADCPPIAENFEGQPVVAEDSDPYAYKIEVEVEHAS
jgi:cytochrome c oxidase subunit 1